MCVGKNYQDHVMEMGSAADIPKDVMIFTKAPTSVVGHEADILLHEDVTSELDYEGSLPLSLAKQERILLLKRSAITFSVTPF